MATKIHTHEDTDRLKAILQGDTHSGQPKSQFRLDDLQQIWDGPHHGFKHALYRLIERGEVEVFPIGAVTKVRLA